MINLLKQTRTTTPKLHNAVTRFTERSRKTYIRYEVINGKSDIGYEGISGSLQGKIAMALETNKTYASAASTGVKDTSSAQGNALHSVIETNNADIVIEYECQRRENNIIIHGVD